MATTSAGHRYDVTQVRAQSLAPLAAGEVAEWTLAPAYARAAPGGALPAGSATPLGPGG
ncbi:MAG: hypothetical protein IT545_09720 [Rhodobacteraceae bacterium]|nr:hypothetical protein [Paracoccaceae bacterium]